MIIQPRDFDVDKRTGNITLLDTPPPIIKDWITFGNQTFTVRPGEVYTQKVKISLPKESGFSYSLTLVITRAGQDAKIESGAVYRGSVATFTLINVDRPGATRKFDVTNFKTTQGIYEYLPAEFDIDFRNTGNTIIQPVGNVFIHKGNGGGDPISVIPLNPARGYLLPDRPRTLDTTWTEGFPVYKTSRGADGQEKQDLVWDWSKISDFRIGQYTAKLVAVYNDGKRDIPIEKTVTFWVIPWRIILGSILVLIVFGVGAYVILRKSGKLISRKKR